MAFYTRTEARKMINEDLKFYTLNSWIEKIVAWTDYNFEVAVPTSENAWSYRNGQPVKRLVLTEDDIELMKRLYDLKVVKGKLLPYAIAHTFLSEGDLEKWENGEYEKTRL